MGAFELKKKPSVLSLRKMMVLLFFLITVSISLAVGLIIWQQNRYASLRITSLAFHPQSITELSDTDDHLNDLKIWVVRVTDNQGEILLKERRILGEHPLEIISLIEQHILFLRNRQSAMKIDKYNRVADRALNHVRRLTQLITPDYPDKTIQAINLDRQISSLSLDLLQWRRMHEIDFVQDEIVFNDFKDQINQLFYVILILLGIISIPLVILFVRRINLTLHQIEVTQNELFTLNGELENRVEQRTQELSEIQETLVRNERLAALGQLTGTVSHELRNPLGTITTSLFTLRNKLQTHNIDADKILDRVDRNIKRCDAIVEDLLQYSRIQALHLELLDFEAWFEEIINDYKYLEDLMIHNEIEPIGIIKFDPHRLRRVFINLLDNAVRAMSVNNKIIPGSGIWVKVASEQSGVLISITDNGSGIPAGEVSRIFEPLFSTYAFGVGLGLPTALQIMEQHGGTVYLDTDVHEGASFCCWLPYSLVKKEHW